MHFLYLINGNLTAAGLAEAGLNHLPPAATLITRTLLDGPQGAGRTLLADGHCPADRLYYRPNEQTWQAAANGTYWIGTWNDAIPNERSLRRNSIIDGHRVSLGDGGQYIIPLARKFPAGSNLPMAMVLTADGLTLRQKPQFAKFCGRAEKLWRQFCREMGWIAPDADDAMTAEEQFALAVEALGLNYHLGGEECSMLGLIDTASLPEILTRIVDVPTLQQQLAARMEQLKKKDCPCPQDNSSDSAASGPDRQEASAGTV
jgi:hypothetical protein